MATDRRAINSANARLQVHAVALQAHNAQIRALDLQGVSFGEIGRRLACSRNTVAGVSWRGRKGRARAEAFTP